jgi:membrane-bound inhibitor of C-type lysozyme
MDRHKAIILAFVLLAGGTFQAQPASAQTFRTYHCADGTQFIVGFYDYDKRAFVQIDGEPITLARRPTVSGARYSGAGITLKIGKTGTTTVKHLKRPVTACEVI